MPRFPVPLALAAVLLAGAPAHAALSGPEQRMIATVDAERDRHIALLQRLVDQNSGSHNLAGVEAVGRMIRAELEPLGFRVRWIPLRETGRAGHLVATHAGRPGGKRLLLIGHLDTVFEPVDFDKDFDRASKAGENLTKMFEGIIGCDHIIEKLRDCQNIYQVRKAQGKDPREVIPMSYVFKGPPGTCRASHKLVDYLSFV